MVSIGSIIVPAVLIVIVLAVVMRGKEIGAQIGGFGTGLVPFGVGIAQVGAGAGQAFTGFGRGFGQGIIGMMEPLFWASAKIQEWWPGDTAFGLSLNRERGLDAVLYRERTGRI